MSNDLDTHFVTFAESLSGTIDRLEAQDDLEFLERQKQQFEELVRLEGEFQDAVNRSPYGEAVLARFISFIRDDCRNILDARPYFRERQTVFTPQIANALKDRKGAELYAFRWNYRMIRFIMS